MGRGRVVYAVIPLEVVCVFPSCVQLAVLLSLHGQTVGDDAYGNPGTIHDLENAINSEIR